MEFDLLVYLKWVIMVSGFKNYTLCILIKVPFTVCFKNLIYMQQGRVMEWLM